MGSHSTFEGFNWRPDIIASLAIHSEGTSPKYSFLLNFMPPLLSNRKNLG